MISSLSNGLQLPCKSVTSSCQRSNVRKASCTVAMRGSSSQLSPSKRLSVFTQTGRQPKRALCKAVTRCVQDITTDTFEEVVIKSSVPVLVDFWATWCGPCKLVAPLMEWTEKEFGDSLKVVKIETDPNPALVEEYKVYGLPALRVFKDGKLIDGSVWEGAMTKKQLTQYLEKFGIVPVAA